jgi:GntR family transcriptional regulator of vanillate catabolism
MLMKADSQFLDQTSPDNGVVGKSDIGSQTARAFAGIRKLLLLGEFVRGERISELPLTDRLCMSRTPIRLALERLAHVGLLDVGLNGGFFVRGFTVEDVRDAIELRGILEGTAGRLAAERLVDTSELAAAFHHQEHADDSARSIDSFGEYMDANEAFHAAIVSLAKSEMLHRSVQYVISLPFASPSAMVSPTSRLATPKEWLTIAQEQHRAILDAISKRQGTRAEHLAREHAQHSLMVFEFALSDESVLTEVPGSMLINTSNRASA